MSAFFRLRPYKPAEDFAYIEDSWVRTDQCARDNKGGVGYVVNQKALIRRIIARPTTEVRIACAADDEDALHGYAVVEALVPVPRVYYVYVRRTSMKHGIASMLLRDLVTKRNVVYTHRPYSELFSDLSRARKIPAGWSFSDFANFDDQPLRRTNHRGEYPGVETNKEGTGT